MYKTKPCHDCDMPAPALPLRTLVLNASLKHAPTTSNTQEVAELVLEYLAAHGVSGESVRLADRNIPVGLGYRESDKNEWPDIVARLKAVDIVIFATPIWWGGRSSLMQRVIERLVPSTRSTGQTAAALSTTRSPASSLRGARTAPWRLWDPS
jgi:multimeric flavodoxin WrbA